MTISPQDLRAVGLAAYGYGWQRALARAIGVNERTMRRYASGATPVPPGVARDIRRVLGAAGAPGEGWPRDEWILGDGATGPDGSRREYIVHTRAPRFIARIVYGAGPAPTEGGADTITGIVYESDGFALAQIVWIDPPPGPAELAALMDAALLASAVSSWTARASSAGKGGTRLSAASPSFGTT